MRWRFVVSFCVFEGGVSAKSVFEECLAGVSANSVSQDFLSKRVFKECFQECRRHTVFKRCFPCVSCQACLPKIVFPRVFSTCRGQRVSENPSSCPLSSFLLSPFFSSTWHSGSWDAAHYWHGSLLVCGTILSHVVSPVLKGAQAQDTHAVRSWFKVEHALLHGAQAQDTAVVRRWLQVEHTLYATLWQPQRVLILTQYLATHGTSNEHSTF